MPLAPPAISTNVDRLHLLVPVSDGIPIAMVGLQHQAQGPPGPRGDPTCKGCIAPATAPYRFDKTNEKYIYGEILRVNESVHAPVDPLFASIAHARAESPNKAKPRGRDKGLRPTVVLTARPIDLERDETYIMLMATYTGIFRLTELPAVLQLFCAPISPHYEIQAGVEHLHTTPEWQKDHVWLLALPFSSLGEVFGRWKWKDQYGKFQSGYSFIIDENMLSELAETQGRKWDEWSRKSLAEDGYLEGCYEEYEHFKFQGYLRSHYREYSENADLDSTLTLHTHLESKIACMGVPEQLEGGGNRQLISDVGVQTSLLPRCDPQSPSPNRRPVFGTAPLLNLESDSGEGVSLLPGIEDRLRTMSLATFEVPTDPQVSQENLNNTRTASMERTRKEPSNARRAPTDAILAMAQQKISAIAPSAAIGSNSAIRGGPQGTVLQHAASEEATDREESAGAVGKPAKKSRRKWSRLFSLGDIRRKPQLTD